MNHPADQRLVEAVQTGDEVAAGQALADGADPNVTVGRLRGSVLAEAARSGLLGIVGLLVDAGARIGPADPYSASPLRAAVLEAHVTWCSPLSPTGRSRLSLPPDRVC